MLKRGWMARYMPPVGLVWARDVVVAFGYVWALLMFEAFLRNQEKHA